MPDPVVAPFGEPLGMIGKQPQGPDFPACSVDGDYRCRGESRPDLQQILMQAEGVPRDQARTGKTKRKGRGRKAPSPFRPAQGYVPEEKSDVARNTSAKLTLPAEAAASLAITLVTMNCKALVSVLAAANGTADHS